MEHSIPVTERESVITIFKVKQRKGDRKKSLAARRCEKMSYSVGENLFGASFHSATAPR